MKNRYEEYLSFEKGIPFVLNPNIKRSAQIKSREANWHDNIEVQLCMGGEGEVLIDGKYYPLRENEAVVVNSSLVHHTKSDRELVYTCIIISSEFCKSVGIDPEKTEFEAHIQSPDVLDCLLEICKVYESTSDPLRAARLQALTLGLLILLYENHLVSLNNFSKGDDCIKNAINYIKAHYSEKISLDKMSSEIYMNKFVLSRHFKAKIGMTVFEYINSYRCNMASRLIASGQSVKFAAHECGFANMSFFSKTFKRYMGALPSEFIKKEALWRTP